MGKNRNVYVTIQSCRIFMPYGRIISRSAYSILLNFEKKLLVNTGVSENQPRMERFLNKAGISFREIDYVINMSSKPEHIGLNAVIQYHNKKAEFYAHPAEIPYIEDTVRQHEERYIPGFFKLVSGNTNHVHSLENGQKIRLGEESAIISLEDGQDENGVKLYLPESGIWITPDEIIKDNFREIKDPDSAKLDLQTAG